MNAKTLPSRHRIRNSSPVVLNPTIHCARTVYAANLRHQPNVGPMLVQRLDSDIEVTRLIVCYQVYISTDFTKSKN